MTTGGWDPARQLFLDRRGRSRLRHFSRPATLIYVTRRGRARRTTPRWSLRQIPEVQGGFMANGRQQRPGDRHAGAGSPTSIRCSTAPPRRRASPARRFKPFVYAAALDSGFSPAEHRHRRADRGRIPAGGEILGGRATPRTGSTGRRRSGPASSSRANLMDRASRPGNWDGPGRGLCRALRGLRPDGPVSRQCPRLRGDDALPHGRGLRDVRQRAASGSSRRSSTGVQDRWGQTIYRHDDRDCEGCGPGANSRAISPPRSTSDRQRVINAVTAYQLTSMMRGVVDRGTASGAVNLPGADRRQDRHDERRPRRLVRRLQPRKHRGGLLHRLRPAETARARRVGRARSARRCSRRSLEKAVEALRRATGRRARQVQPVQQGTRRRGTSRTRRGRRRSSFNFPGVEGDWSSASPSTDGFAKGTAPPSPPAGEGRGPPPRAPWWKPPTGRSSPCPTRRPSGKCPRAASTRQGGRNGGCPLVAARHRLSGLPPQLSPTPTATAWAIRGGCRA